MNLSKKERDAMKKTLYGAATLTLEKSSAYQLFDDLDEKDKWIKSLSHPNFIGQLLDDIDERDNRIAELEAAIKPKDKEIEALEQNLAAAEETIVHKDNEIKRLSAEIDTHRLRIIRLREVLDD